MGVELSEVKQRTCTGHLKNPLPRHIPFHIADKNESFVAGRGVGFLNRELAIHGATPLKHANRQPQPLPSEQTPPLPPRSSTHNAVIYQAGGMFSIGGRR